MSEVFTSTDEQREKLPGGVTGRGFRPGQSGNPGGRRKSDVAALARQHTPDAISALVAALNSPKERVPAAVALLDRGWGKPVQMVVGDPDRPVAVDFRWADATPAAPMIEGEAQDVEISFENDDSENAR